MQDDDRTAGAGRAIEEAAARFQQEDETAADTGGTEAFGADGRTAGEPDDVPGDPGLPGDGEDVPPEVPDPAPMPQRDIPEQAGAKDPDMDDPDVDEPDVDEPDMEDPEMEDPDDDDPDEEDPVEEAPDMDDPDRPMSL